MLILFNVGVLVILAFNVRTANLVQSTENSRTALNLCADTFTFNKYISIFNGFCD